MSQVIAEYKVGKAVYQITKEGFVDNINPNIPGLATTYPWSEINGALEYERQENPRTGTPEPVLRWMRVYQKGGALLAEMLIPNDLRPTMLRFFDVFKQTQEQSTKQ